jgi:hypothetical protein
MPLQSVLSSMKFADGSESIIEVRTKTAEYFGIKEVKPQSVTVQRRAYTYYRHDGLTNEPGKVITVHSTRYTCVPHLNAKSVREVRVPTEMVTPRGFRKTYGIKFPVKTDYIEISHWLYWNCTRHKPTYFLTEAGKHRGVYDWSNEGVE